MSYGVIIHYTAFIAEWSIDVMSCVVWWLLRCEELFDVMRFLMWWAMWYADPYDVISLCGVMLCELCDEGMGYDELCDGMSHSKLLMTSHNQKTQNIPYLLTSNSSSCPIPHHITQLFTSNGSPHYIACHIKYLTTLDSSSHIDYIE